MRHDYFPLKLAPNLNNLNQPHFSIENQKNTFFLEVKTHINNILKIGSYFKLLSSNFSDNFYLFALLVNFVVSETFHELGCPELVAVSCRQMNNC
jgi:hypothetical protein